MSDRPIRVTTWTKKMTKPRVKVYRPADTKPHIGFNRYGDLLGHDGVIIGIYAVAFKRCFAFGWAKPVPHTEFIYESDD